MTKNVVISLTGLQYVQSEADAPIEVITFGSYFVKDDEIFLFYEEIQDDQSTVKCRIRIGENRVEMNKQDDAHTRLCFEKGEKTITNYRTPYGDILVGLTTYEVHRLLTEDYAEITLKYALDINDEKAADCTLVVKVQSCQNSEESLRKKAMSTK